MWLNWRIALKRELDRYSPGGKLPSSRALVERYPGLPGDRLPGARPAGRRRAGRHPARSRGVPRRSPATPGSRARGHLLAGGHPQRRRGGRTRPPHRRRLRGPRHPRRARRRASSSSTAAICIPRSSPNAPWPPRWPARDAAPAPGAGRPPTGCPSCANGSPAASAAAVERRRRTDHGGRPVRADHRPAGARPARRARPRRVADLPGHAGHRTGRRSAAGPGARGRRRGAHRNCSPPPSGPPAPASSSASRSSRTRPARCSSAERRPEVLRIARAAGAFVVEDDFARRLAHEDAGPLPSPLAADDHDGVVVHVSSLTKVTSPSLRVGMLAARGPVLERLRAIHVVDNFFVPRPAPGGGPRTGRRPRLEPSSADRGSRVEAASRLHGGGSAAASARIVPAAHPVRRLPPLAAPPRRRGRGGAALGSTARGCRPRPRPPLLLRRAPGRVTSG